MTKTYTYSEINRPHKKAAGQTSVLYLQIMDGEKCAAGAWVYINKNGKLLTGKTADENGVAEILLPPGNFEVAITGGDNKSAQFCVTVPILPVVINEFIELQ